MTLPRVKRASGAAVTIPKVSAGNTKWIGEPQPQGGNQPSPSAKTKAKIGPRTNEGTQIPNNVNPIGTQSSHVLGRDAASTPTGMPMSTAMSSALRPSWIETGIREPMTSLTDQPGYLREGPRSPLQRLPT